VLVSLVIGVTIQLLDNVRSYLEPSGVNAQLYVWLGGQYWLEWDLDFLKVVNHDLFMRYPIGVYAGHLIP
jgi:hypothetical protein